MHLGAEPQAKNSKIRRDLGTEFRALEKTIHDAVHDLVERGHLSI